MKQHGFTLLETMLALMIFCVAVVALVEAVHQLGDNTLHRRREAQVQERMRSLLLEHTRLPEPLQRTRMQEADVLYTVVRTPLELRNQEGQPLDGLVEVRVTAEWHEGRLRQQASAGTWVYPPLFRR